MPAPDYHNYKDKLHAAAGRVDTSATKAQREALNFRQGHAHVHGLEIAIEYPKGSTRSGTSRDGKSWSRKMTAHYGRIKRTVGKDDEPVDVFIGDHPESQLVFVISQLDDDGNLDEHKITMGVRNYREARDLYLSHYPDGWARKHLGEVRGMTMCDFKAWLDSNCPVKNTSNRKKKAAGVPALPVIPVVSFADALRITGLT